MQYASLMINVDTKDILKKIQEKLDEKYNSKHTYSRIISTALLQYAKQEKLEL